MNIVIDKLGNKAAIILRHKAYYQSITASKLYILQSLWYGLLACWCPSWTTMTLC